MRLKVLEAHAPKTRDGTPALAILRRAMKRYGSPKSIVTDRIASYGAALRSLGIKVRQRYGRWLNNRAEYSHQIVRRRKGAMARIRDISTLQRFAAVQSALHNRFNLERRPVSRTIFKQRRAAALAEWRFLAG